MQYVQCGLCTTELTYDRTHTFLQLPVVRVCSFTLLYACHDLVVQCLRGVVPRFHLEHTANHCHCLLVPIDHRTMPTSREVSVWPAPAVGVHNCILPVGIREIGGKPLNRRRGGRCVIRARCTGALSSQWFHTISIATAATICPWL
jgi:hypothetical protein